MRSLITSMGTHSRHDTVSAARPATKCTAEGRPARAGSAIGRPSRVASYIEKYRQLAGPEPASAMGKPRYKPRSPSAAHTERMASMNDRYGCTCSRALMVSRG